MRNTISAVVLLSSLVAGCAASPSAVRLPRGARIIDLTHPFDEETIYWPTATTGFVLSPVYVGRTDAGYFYSAYTMCAPEHGGTHLDAPVHFAEGKATTDAIPLSRLLGPAVVVDVSAAAQRDVDYRVTRADIDAFERDHGAIEPGSIVMIRTGWGSRWPDKKRYLGDDRPGHAESLHFPGLGEDAARALVARKVASVGIDTASIDYGPSRGFLAHRTLLGAEIPVFENVASLRELPLRGALVVALPMKIRGGSGGPLRIVAVLPR